MYFSKMMMYYRVLLLVVTTLGLSVKSFCQDAQYIIRFTDKNNSSFSLDAPAGYLSQRAIERRQRYNIAFDSSDLPVNESYIHDVVATGNVTYLSASKWLNAILISCPANMLAQINQLPFVVSSQPVSLAGNPPGNIVEYDELVKPLNNSGKENGIAGNLNYGSSFNQVHIHNGDYLHDKGYTGGTMQIAVLDAGFYQYKTIAAFDSIRTNGQVLGEKDFVAYDNSVNEDNSHGELCLSIIAANVPGKMVGTAPAASFWLIRTEDVSFEKPVEEFNWVVGAEYADSCGCRFNIIITRLL